MTSPKEDDNGGGHKKPTPEMNKRMGIVLKTKGNDVCADCPAKRPLWVSFLGGNMDKSRKIAVLCCPKCAQYHHFELGKKRTLIKYLKMAHEFNMADIEILEQSGNTYVNEMFEAKLSKEDFDKLLVLDNEEEEAERRSKFIKNKYKKNKYQDEVVYYQRMLEIAQTEEKFEEINNNNNSNDKDRKSDDHSHRSSSRDRDDDRALRKSHSHNKLEGEALKDPSSYRRDFRQNRSRSMDHTAPTLAKSPYDTPEMRRSQTSDEVGWQRGGPERSSANSSKHRVIPANEARRNMRLNRSFNRSRSPTAPSSSSHRNSSSSRSPHRSRRDDNRDKDMPRHSSRGSSDRDKDMPRNSSRGGSGRDMPPRESSRSGGGSRSSSRRNLHKSSPSLSFDMTMSDDHERKKERPAFARQISLPRQTSLRAPMRLESGSKALEELRQEIIGKKPEKKPEEGKGEDSDKKDDKTSDDKPEGQEKTEEGRKSPTELRGRLSRQSSPSCLKRENSFRKSVSRESSPRRKSCSPDAGVSRESSRRNLSRESSRRGGLSRESSKKHMSRESSKKHLGSSSHHKKSLSRQTSNSNTRRNISFSRENSSKRGNLSRQNSLQKQDSMRHSAPDPGTKELDELREAIEKGLQENSEQESQPVPRDSDFRHSAPVGSEQQQDKSLEDLRKEFNSGSFHARAVPDSDALKYQGENDILLDDSESCVAGDKPGLTAEHTAGALDMPGTDSSKKTEKTALRSPRRKKPTKTWQDSAPVLNLDGLGDDKDKEIPKNSRRNKKKNFHDSAPIPYFGDMEEESLKSSGSFSLEDWIKPTERKGPRERNTSMMPVHMEDPGLSQSPKSKKKSLGAMLPSNSPRSKKKSLDFLKGPIPKKGARPQLRRALSQDSLLIDGKPDAGDDNKPKKKGSSSRDLSSLLDMDSADLAKARNSLSKRESGNLLATSAH